MKEQERKALVREVLARRLAALGPPDAPADAADSAPHVTVHAHASHDVYVTLVNVGDACLIEPSVPCSHCNYCKSHGY